MGVRMDVARMYGLQSGVMPGWGGLTQAPAEHSARREIVAQPMITRPELPAKAAAVPEAVRLEAVMAQVNTELQSMGSSLKFTVDETSDRRLVKVVDTETGETIRQMPSKEMLAIARALENRQGLMLSEMA